MGTFFFSALRKGYYISHIQTINIFKSLILMRYIASKTVFTFLTHFQSGHTIDKVGKRSGFSYAEQRPYGNGCRSCVVFRLSLFKEEE